MNLLFRWLHHFKALVLTVAVLAVVASCVGFVWLNQHGFDGKWSERIAQELAQRGIHAEFESVRFSPKRGIVARKVIFFTDETRQDIFARIPVLRFDVDRGKAFRGELQIRRVFLEDAQLSVPVGGGVELQINNLTGRASVDRLNRLLLKADHGSLGGMNFQLEIELDGFELANLQGDGEAKSSQRRNAFTKDLLTELARWSFPSSTPPELKVSISGSLNRPESIRTKIALRASELMRRDYPMRNVVVSAELDNRTLSIDELHFSDGSGDLQLQAHYDLEDKTGAYDFTSTIKIADLLRKGLNDHTLREFTSIHAPQLSARGEFSFGEVGMQLNAIGKFEWEDFRFLGVPLERISTDFSWQDGDIYLRDIQVQHEGRELTGEVKVKDDLILYRATTSLPFSAYRPFIKEGSGIDYFLAQSSFTEKSKVTLEAHGSIQKSDLNSWDSSGHLHFEDFSYNQIPLKYASADFYITQLDAVYTNLETEFLYHSYALNQKHGGPPSGTVKADEVHFDAETKLVKIQKLRGRAWPGPILRLFVPEAAEHIEDQYRFRSPPDLVASGVIDTNMPGGPKTDMRTHVTARGTTDYRFLDRTLQLTGLSADVRTRRNLHDITNLKFRTLGGSGSGFVTVRERPGMKAAFNGGIKWDNLALAEIGKKYSFEKAAHGWITGRIDFSSVVGSTRAFNGRGVVGLKNGQLFHVPIFGPLSLPLGGILGKKFAHEQARDASATFIIKNGVAYTKDLLTSTPSTKFVGEGQIDLATNQIDLTMRMNARGLLGLVTLPLSPFKGLFQFRGRGPLKKPVWRADPFTQPAGGKNHPIFRDPPKAKIVPER